MRKPAHVQASAVTFHGTVGTTHAMAGAAVTGAGALPAALHPPVLCRAGFERQGFGAGAG